MQRIAYYRHDRLTFSVLTSHDTTMHDTITGLDWRQTSRKHLDWFFGASRITALSKKPDGLYEITTDAITPHDSLLIPQPVSRSPNVAAAS